MALDIYLITEMDEILESLPDLQDSLGKYLLHPEFTEKSKLLKYVNLFGNTIFNTLQMKELVEDLNVLRTELDSKIDQMFIDQLIDLIKKSRKTPHLYIKFVGD